MCDFAIYGVFNSCAGPLEPSDMKALQALAL
jgi:hypothetical protein